MGGRVRIVALLPRDDRRRDRGACVARSSEPGSPAIESISAFFPCLQRRSDDRVDGESRGRRRSTGSAPTAKSSSSTTARPTARPPCSRDLPRGSRWLRVVTHERNRGYGGALLSGFAAATKQWVFYTDGDGAVRSRRARAARRAARPTTSTSCRATRSGEPTTSPAGSSGGCTTDSCRSPSGCISATPTATSGSSAATLDRITLEHDDRRDLRRDGAQASGRRRAVRRGRHPPLPAAARAVEVLPRRQRGPLAVGPRRAVGAARRPAPGPKTGGRPRVARTTTDVPKGTSPRVRRRRSGGGQGSEEPVQ